jgi:hypothetical protein
LGRAGIAIAGIVYLLGAASIAVVFRRIVTPGFRAPAILLSATALIAATLAAWALARGSTAARPARSGSGETAASVWTAALTALVASALWLQLFALPQFLRRGALVLVPMAVAVCVALGAGALLARWSRPGAGWTDLHCLAAIAGAVTASSAFGAHVLQSGAAFDRAGQAACSVLSLVLLWALRGKLNPRPAGIPNLPRRRASRLAQACSALFRWKSA